MFIVGDPENDNSINFFTASNKEYTAMLYCYSIYKHFYPYSNP